MGINMGMYNGVTSRHNHKASFSCERETEYYCHQWGQCKDYVMANHWDTVA